MKSKKAFYNIFTQVSYEVVAFICSLILPRLILKNFGSDYNGIVSSITQFLEYISILTLGISGSTRVAIYKAKGDITQISRVIKATHNYMKKIAYFFILYAIILSVIYPLIIHSDIEYFQVSLLVIIIAIGTFSEYFFGVTYNALTAALQCKYIHNIILIVIKIVTTVFSSLLIVWGYNIYVVKLVGALLYALGPILLYYVMNRKYHIISNIEPDDLALSQRKDVMAHSVANCVHQYTDIFLLSFFSDAKIVSIYSVYNLVLNGIKKSEKIFTNGLEGAFGEIWAKNQKESFAKNFELFEFLIFCFVSVLFTSTFFLFIPFIKIYTKNVTDINYIIPTYAYLSMLAMAIFCIRTPYVIAVQAAGKYKETKNGAILEAVLNFLISLILIFPFGIIGVTIGTLVANLFRTIQYELFISTKLINRCRFSFLKRVIWLLSCFGIGLAFNQLLPYTPSIDSWNSWIVWGIIYFLMSFLITFIMAFIFYKDNLIKSLEFVQKMIKRKKRVLR